MDIKWFKEKQRVELHIETESGVLNLSTHIEQITDAGEFIVAAPFYQGQLYPFLSKEHVELVTIIDSMGIISCDVVVSKDLETVVLFFCYLKKYQKLENTKT